MSLPKHIADHLRTIPFNPSILSSDPELAYVLSFAEHRKFLLIKQYQTSQFIFIQKIPISLLYHNISLLISTIQHLIIYFRKPTRIISTRMYQWLKALGLRLSSSMRECQH